MSMAPKWSDLVDKMPKASLQVDGQVEVPNQGTKDLWETEEEGSSPLSCHHGPLPRGHHQATLIQNIVWRYE